MQSRVKFAGHPIHPMLVVFPLGLLGTAVIFDIIYLISDNARWAVAAYYMIGAGLIGGFGGGPLRLARLGGNSTRDPGQAHRPLARVGERGRPVVVRPELGAQAR